MELIKEDSVSEHSELVCHTAPRLAVLVYRKVFLWGGLWLLCAVARAFDLELNLWITAFLDVFIGLALIQVACHSLLLAIEGLSAKFYWDPYVAATWAEILSTLPELVVVAFLVAVDPYLAFLMVMITIYNNAMVFSCYSFFLPKDVKGKYLMPPAITEIGTQILVAGGALGIVVGSMMLGLLITEPAVQGFSQMDMVFLALVLLGLFVLYMYRLTVYYSRQNGVPEEPHPPVEKLKRWLDRFEIKRFRDNNSWFAIVMLFLAGLVGSVLGGSSVHDFAELTTSKLKLDPYIAAFILAGFGGMSEYVILWNAHREKQYGIALANAFGGMTQVLFLILPITLLLWVSHGWLHGAVATSHASLGFNTSSILLFIFLFPTFYTLTALLEKDHTFDLLDTGVMVAIVAILLYLLISYGNGVH